ncbi:hypothetical protein FRC11_014874 [Ceratobasidium sp. 423]|nr:hypothetical protein FRC11_014874 [Ceratobasidium sp. 423]
MDGMPTQDVRAREGHIPSSNLLPPRHDPGPTLRQSLHVETGIPPGGSAGTWAQRGSGVALVQSPSSYLLPSPTDHGVPSIPRHKVVEITFDGANYARVDLTRHSDPGAVRRDIISRLPSTTSSFSSFDIFRTDPPGSVAALNDGELMLDIEHFGDDRGTLKFLVRTVDGYSDSHLPTYARAAIAPPLLNPPTPIHFPSPHLIPSSRSSIADSGGWYGSDAPTPSTSGHTTDEVLSHLYERGCKNVANELDESSTSRNPVARGGGGDVYSGEFHTGKRVALKCVRLAIGNEDRNKLKKTAHELYVWSKCNHPNVLELIGVTHHRDQVAMVSPWMDNGDLLTFLRQHPGADRHDLCVQIAEGTAYLHSQAIVHGDIKGANVLISQDLIAKITDFGTSALKNYTLEFAATKSKPGLSIRWAAPEILEDKSDNSYEADVYSLAMTILEAITGDIPYAYVTKDCAKLAPHSKKIVGVDINLNPKPVDFSMNVRLSRTFHQKRRRLYALVGGLQDFSFKPAFQVFMDEKAADMFVAKGVRLRL